MIIGIVGSELAKFTMLGRARARHAIALILAEPGVTEVVSGGCHLGGVDAWAAEIGAEMGMRVTEFLPSRFSWEMGYKIRNLRIVARAQVLHCFTVDLLPSDFAGPRYLYCYHCQSYTHIKSGGCWTMKQAIKKGKAAELHIVPNY